VANSLVIMDDASATNTDATTLTHAEIRATKKIVRTHRVSLTVFAVTQL